MDTSENNVTFIYNENVYIPASDNEYDSDEYDSNLCLLQPVSHVTENENETTDEVHVQQNGDTDSGLYQNTASPSSSNSNENRYQLHLQENRDADNLPDENIASPSSSNENTDQLHLEQNMENRDVDPLPDENIASPASLISNENTDQLHLEQNIDVDPDLDENIPSPPSSISNQSLHESVSNQNGVNLENIYQQNRNLHRNQPGHLFNVYDTDSNSSDNEDEQDGNNSDASLPNHPQREFMTNYNGDKDDPNDFGLGWEWKMSDTDGASSGPFTATPGLQIQPDGQSPLDYVKLFVPNSFLFQVAEQTNLYAANKQQGKNIFMNLYLFISH